MSWIQENSPLQPEPQALFYSDILNEQLEMFKFPLSALQLWIKSRENNPPLISRTN